MPTEKTPIRAVFSGSTATGLAEYQTDEVIGVTFGGTGVATLTSNSILLGNGTSAVQSSSIRISGSSLSSSDSSLININEGLVVDGTLNVNGTTTITGNLTVTGTTTTVNSTTIDIGNSFTFEGATSNDFETTLGVTDPTADRTINLPNVSGTVITTGNISDITGLTISQISDASFTLVDDSSTTTTISLGEALKIAGGSGIDTTISGDTLTIALESTIVTETSSDTLTNKSISLSTNTITGTLAEFNTAVSNADLVSLAGSETLTNKTLTTPIISSISNTGTLTLPTSTDTLVGKATTDTLTNKSISLTTNTITGTLAEFNTAVSNADLASLAGSETLTNKTISGSSNTLSNIANSSLTNSSITLVDDSSSTTTISLGESLKISGTSNEIETAISGDTITIGLPSNVTIGNNLIVTGDLTVSGTTTTVNSTTIDITNSFTFEGATADSFETTLGVIDPTADRAINLPNVSGTVITTGNITDITGLSNSSLSNSSFTIVDDSSTTSTISLGESLLLVGGTGITSVISGDSITFNIDSTVTTLTGTQTLTNKTFTSPKINEDVAITATATELNYTDGVTSAIQTQLDARASKAFAIAQAVALG